MVGLHIYIWGKKKQERIKQKKWNLIGGLGLEYLRQLWIVGHKKFACDTPISHLSAFSC